MHVRKFVIPEVVFGTGAIDLAGQYAKKLGGRTVLIVSDPGVKRTGWTDRVVHSVKKEGLTGMVFTAVSPNPREHEVMEGADFYRSNDCNCIVAVGGGSAIDCAKGIGIVCTNHLGILEFEGIDQVEVPMPPIVCIPTTGGSSADVSQFAIIKDTERKTKIAIISKAIVPDVAIIDPETLMTMEPYLSACTGLDALVHSIEAFVSNAGSHLTDVHALQAIRLITGNLLRSLREPGNVELRIRMMQGSMEAGFAFSNASLGAVHAMAHSLGGFLDLAHGECNAMLLRHVIDYNFHTEPERYRQVAETMGLDLRGMREKDVKQVILKTIDDLAYQAGIRGTLGPKGVKTGDIPDLSSRAIADPCIVTNPREPDRRDIEVIYEEAL